MVAVRESDTRAQILSSAASLFLERGYAAVSLRDIAAEAKLTTGSLYYYFSQKDEIVREILDAGHRHVHEEVSRRVGRLGPKATRSEKMRAGIRAHLDALFEKNSFPAANVRIYAHVPPEVRAEVRAGRRAYERYWIDLLEQHDESGPLAVDPKQLVMLLFGAANWTLEWYREGRDSLDEIADSLTRVFAHPADVVAPAKRARKR